MQLDKLIELGFMGLITGILTYISHSVVKLNDHVATLLERTDWHRKSIGGLDNRVTKLEEQKRRHGL